MVLNEGFVAFGPLAVVDVDPDLAFFTALVFAITLGVLWRFAWKPIMEGLDKREQSISGKIEQARIDAEKSEALLKEYEVKLTAAADEAKAILAEARREGESLREKMVGEAREAADRERERAVADIQAAKNQAIRDIAQRSVDSAVQLAGNLVRKELNTEMHAKLIEESLARFGSDN